MRAKVEEVADFVAEFRKRYEAISVKKRQGITDLFMSIEGPTMEADPDVAWDKIATIMSNNT